MRALLLAFLGLGVSLPASADPERRPRFAPIAGADLEELLVGMRMHAPDCQTRDGCEEIFLPGGAYRRRISPTEWKEGSFAVRGGRYCTQLSGRTRCHKLLQSAASATFGYRRVAEGRSPSKGRQVLLIPARGRGDRPAP